MSEETTFAYDKLLYPNYLHPQTHPDRLATMTRFFGVEPQPVENCRVLELGCGTASSLLSFALDLPESEFVGIDLSEKQIEFGQQAARAANIGNLALHHEDIMQIDRARLGEFDYIIAHGLYSWVPAAVRDRILQICREMLTAHGVAFISYNTLPGCRFRQIAREIMSFHTRDLPAPIEKVNHAVGFLKFVADASPPGKIYKQVLEAEFEKLAARTYENIFHDDLAENNHPVYFHEFVAHAARHDLQFVAEVEYFPTRNKVYPAEIMEILGKISGDVIALEQNLDFIEGRLFRHTLLCRREIDLHRHPDSQILRQIRISSPLRPVSEKPELATHAREVFAGGKNESIEISHPMTKAAFFYLGKIWKDSVTFDELIAAAKQILIQECGDRAADELTAADEEVLAQMLFQVFSPRILSFHTHEAAFATAVSEKPLASPLARWQTQFGETVSTLLCTEFLIRDELGKRLLRLLDGTRDRKHLVAELSAYIESEEFAEPDAIKRDLCANLPAQLEKSLEIFAQMALLVR